MPTRLNLGRLMILLLLTLGVSCSGHIRHSAPTPPPGKLWVTPIGSMTFFAEAPEGLPLAEVEVIAINSMGLQSVGVTGDQGALTIEARVLREANPYAIVFCHRHFPCGAIIVDDKFFGYRELHIRLAEAVFY